MFLSHTTCDWISPQICGVGWQEFTCNRPICAGYTVTPSTPLHIQSRCGTIADRDHPTARSSRDHLARRRADAGRRLTKLSRADALLSSQPSCEAAVRTSVAGARDMARSASRPAEGRGRRCACPRCTAYEALEAAPVRCSRWRVSAKHRIAGWQPKACADRGFDVAVISSRRS